MQDFTKTDEMITELLINFGIHVHGNDKAAQKLELRTFKYNNPHPLVHYQ